jgi:hypothetical protein
MVDGGDDDNSDVDAVTGLTWQQIVDTCGPEEVTKLRNRMGKIKVPWIMDTDLQSSSLLAIGSGIGTTKKSKQQVLCNNGEMYRKGNNEINEVLTSS